ncbi:Hypothetical predicted protein [Mytilus galloprovincialis]|uniref:Uncharacterized protein n=1 Tax=Mytilus galloprovincialis TaxID=29158 RepID=A0A8B6EV16_MYTGA|nr:Hypothetical predicted protein [Mytilus galloprovincialis]
MPATKYIKGLRDRLSSAYQLASEASKKAQATQKEAYDLRVRGASIQKGDRVLVKIVYFDGRHKLADKWEDIPYVVLDQPNQEIPVFTVIREDGEGKTKKNYIETYFFQSATSETRNQPTPRPRASKQQKLPVVHATKEDSADDTASTISEDSEVGFVLTADSESSLAEDSDANADISDEVTSLSGDAQIEETEPTGSASEDAESISSEDTTIDDDDVHQDTDELPPVEIRRSGRERRPPAWFRSGQFETSMAVAGRTSIPEWRQKKADYISSLAQTPLFKATGLERDAARTILDIVNHH